MVKTAGVFFHFTSNIGSWDTQNKHNPPITGWSVIFRSLIFVSIFTDANNKQWLVAETVYILSGLLPSKLKLVSLGFYCGYSLMALHVEACHLRVQYNNIYCLHIKGERVHYLCKAGVDSGSISKVAQRSSLPVTDLGCIYTQNQNALLIYRVNVSYSQKETVLCLIFPQSIKRLVKWRINT